MLCSSPLNVAYRSMKMLIHFELLSGVTFCVNKVITFCVKYYYILCHYYILRQKFLHFALLLHFVAEQHLAKERVMECRKDAGSTVNPSAIGLPDQASLSEVRYF